MEGCRSRRHQDPSRAVARTDQAKVAIQVPKAKAGRRNISLPASLVADFRVRWKTQQELRLKLGIGKASADALVFAHPDGAPMSPDATSKEWVRNTATLKLPRVSLHAVRHTHVGQLIASSMDFLTISRRLGHGSPTITLGVYGHLFANTDDRAALIMEVAFAKSRTE